MKKALWAVLLLCCGLAQGQKSGPFNLNTQGTSGSASCAVISLNPATSSTVVINVSGTFSLTLQPAVQVQGQAVANVQVTPSTSTTAQSGPLTSWPPGGAKSRSGGSKRPSA